MPVWGTGKRRLSQQLDVVPSLILRGLTQQKEKKVLWEGRVGRLLILRLSCISNKIMSFIPLVNLSRSHSGATFFFAISMSMYAKSLQLCSILCDPVDCNPPGSSCPWDSPSKSTGLGCHFLLQGIFSGIEPMFLVSSVGKYVLYH